MLAGALLSLWLHRIPMGSSGFACSFIAALASPTVMHLLEKFVVITGECFCGEIKYQIDGPLFDAVSCHCSRCRKAFSAQASAYALVEPDDFQWLSGQDLLTSYVGKHGFGLQFCSKCGSTLCGIYNGKVHGVTLGCLNGNPDVRIGRHIFVGSKASWEVMPEGVLQYDEGVPKKCITSCSIRHHPCDFSWRL